MSKNEDEKMENELVCVEEKNEVLENPHVGFTLDCLRNCKDFLLEEDTLIAVMEDDELSKFFKGFISMIGEAQVDESDKDYQGLFLFGQYDVERDVVANVVSLYSVPHAVEYFNKFEDMKFDGENYSIVYLGSLNPTNGEIKPMQNKLYFRINEDTVEQVKYLLDVENNRKMEVVENGNRKD